MKQYGDVFICLIHEIMKWQRKLPRLVAIEYGIHIDLPLLCCVLMRLGFAIHLQLNNCNKLPLNWEDRR